MTADGDVLVELARSAEHLADLRASADDLLTREWAPERSRDLLETDGPTWAVELWDTLRGLGWADVLVDGTVSDLCVVAEAVGASSAPIPLVTAAVATWAVRTGIPEPELAVVVPGTFSASSRADGVEVSGRQAFVAYADVASHLLVHARGDDGTDVLLTCAAGAVGVERTPLRPLDVMPTAAIELHDVAVGRDAIVATGPTAAALASEARLRVLLGWAAELTGVAAAANTAAVDYARHRVAFDRPIGAFQAVKHRLVDQRAAVEVSRALIGRAALALESGAPDRAALVALAAFWAGDTLRAVPEGAIQVFGGIGYTWDHVAHVYLRRATVLTALIGDRAVHRDVAADWLGGR